MAAAGVEQPRLDAELLLAEAAGMDRARLVADPGAELPTAAGRRFGEMVRRRLRREPVAYILGRRGFRRIELEVDRRVLIPRPESELLVELALELEPRSVLDVGTGSGALALAIADELPGCRVIATDTSREALELASANSRRLGLDDRVSFQQGSVPAAVKVDLLVANLPYVAEREWATLQPELTRWEPREALLGGLDGLDAIRALLATISAPLGAGPISAHSAERNAAVPAAVALEVGDGQAEAVSRLLTGAGFDEVEVRRDLAGIDRVVWGRRA